MRADVLHDGAQVVPVSVRGGEHGANYVRKSILLGPQTDYIDLSGVGRA